MQNELIEIYVKGFLNYKAINPNYSNLLKKRRIKVYAYYAGVILLNKKRTLDKKIVYIVDGTTFRNNESCPLFNRGDDVYRGDFFHSFKELRTFPTFVTELSLGERLSILADCIKTSIRDKRITDLSSFIDFGFLYGFLKKRHPQRVCSRGHYDMMATWLGELSENLGIEYYIYQHGIVSKDITIPCKYYCTAFNGFDQYSLGVFRENYIKNKDCKFNIFPFKPSVDFHDIEKEEGYIYIGIIEQNNKEWTEALLKRICGEKIKIIVMKHPQSQHEYVDENGKDISTTTKIFNFDAVITDYSTMILDYIRAGYKGKVYYTSEKYNSTFADYSEFTFIDAKELRNRLHKDLNLNS